MQGKLGIRPSGLIPKRIRDRAGWREKERANASEADFGPESSAWNIEKVEAFRDAFYEFLGYVRINSKERGGDFCLADGVYEAQYRMLDAIWDGLADDIHDFKVLKSRQLGISTISRALVIFWLGMHRGMQGAMIFDTEAHKEEAREEIEQMLSSLPVSLGFPSITKLNRYNMLLSNNSRLRFMAAGVRTTKSSGVLGRSSGINLVHASEICSWENTEGVTALKNALSKNFPDRLYLWESTARGYNDWHTMWQEAKQDDLHQRTVFIGWWAKDDQRLRKSSAAFQRYGTEPPSEREHQRMADVRQQYGFDIDIEQLAWYRSWTDPLREKAEDEPEDSYMLADQPFTEEECFQQSGSSFFEGTVLKRHAEFAETRRPMGYKFMPGSDFVSTQIYPAKVWRDVDIRVWEEPVSDASYVVAGDPAFGHSAENANSAAQVLRCYADQIEQVAEFASPSVLTHQFAYLLWALVGWYGGQPNSSVLTIIEINGPGEAVWREYNLVRPIVQNGYLRPAAREKGLTNIFDNARAYLYSRSDSMHPGKNYMWKTSLQLKIAVMERLRDFTHNGGLVINSPEVLEEMRTISRNGDEIGAEGSARDDRTIALALGARAWEEKIRRGLVALGRTREQDVARRRMSLGDQFTRFNEYRLQEFFRRKEGPRRSAAYEIARQQLHSRVRMSAPPRGVGQWGRR
jgi:hypothetical protein